MNKVHLLTGSNLDDRKKNLETAIHLIEKNCGKLISSSSVYETAAWGKEDQPSFLNQALEIHTSLAAKELMHQILKIEEEMGRVRNEKYGPRLIDIDILLFNDEKYDLDFLKIPHPEIQNRKFALMPLAEIAPRLNHPVLKKTIAELLQNCSDQLEVKKYS